MVEVTGVLENWEWLSVVEVCCLVVLENAGTEVRVVVGATGISFGGITLSAEGVKEGIFLSWHLLRLDRAAQ